MALEWQVNGNRLVNQGNLQGAPGLTRLINANTFPAEFTVGGQKHRFIVITPQFTSTPVTAADVDAVLQYMLQRYKINLNRIYLTGLSYGGGLSFAYPGNWNSSYASKIAAIVPTASPLPDPQGTAGYDTIYKRSRRIAAANIPVWATHNKRDRYPDSSLNTDSYITGINQAPGANPAARKTIFNASGHDSWSKTYDLNFRENGMNIYEWMLLYQKGSPPPTINVVNVNIYGGMNPYKHNEWTNWNVGTSLQTNKSITNLKYSNGNTSTVGALLSRTETIRDNGSSYGGIMAPDSVLRYSSNATVARSLTLSGLSTAKTYNLELYASRASTSGFSTIFTINGVADTVTTDNNKSERAFFSGLVPNSLGQIVVNITNGPAASGANPNNYINGFTLIENGLSPPPPTTKFVKVNLYAGTNPYSNAEWTNWNIGTGAQSNKSISALKYSNGVASAVGALLSYSANVVDNGSTYGGTMAPAAVLRYASSSAPSRTLTLSGLSTTKTYSLELYASRNNTGYSTVFTINSTSVTITTDKNLTNKASFTGLVPNSNGQIVVNIASGPSTTTTPINYLNGFMLTELSSGGAIANPGQVTERVALPVENTGPGIIQVFPNPVNNTIQLQLQNPYKGAVHVQVTDAAGRVQKNWRFIKNTTRLQQTLPVNNLVKGMYFLSVQMGGAQQTLPITKIE